MFIGVHTAPMKETYEVYESNLAGLVKRLTALSLRSIKLGGTPILIEVGAPKDIAHPKTPNRTVRVFAVTVEGSAPKFAGWSFLATLAHTPDGNVVRSVPGFEVDAKYDGDYLAYMMPYVLGPYLESQRRLGDGQRSSLN